MQDPHSTGSNSPDSPARAAVLSEPQIIEHLKHCRDLARTFAYRVFPHFWRNWCKAMGEYAERARSNKEQVALFEVQRLLSAVQQAAEHEFCQNLGNGFVKFKNKALNTRTGEERFSGDILSLVEHADLEETIAITSITHRADAFHAEALWALQQRFALLNDGEKIDERSNPASPVQFCESLRRVLASMDVDVKTKIIGYKTFEEDVISSLAELYSDINQYLIAQQLMPNLRFVAQNQSTTEHAGSAAENSLDDSPTDVESRQRRASDRLLSGELSPGDVQYQSSLLNAIRLLQAHVNQQVGVANPALPQSVSARQLLQASTAGSVNQVALSPAAELQVYDGEQLVNVLQSLQTQTLMLTRQAMTGQTGVLDLKPQAIAEANRQMLEEIARTSESGAVALADMHTIDLVGMLFEYMLSDDHLPDSIKALLSYLHTPFLKIAFIDKGFFEQPEHPARVLLNSLAEAGVRWVGNDGSEQHDIYAKIKTTVFRLLEEFKNDVRIFAELLLEFNTYTHNVARRQELMERRALEKVQGEEKLRESKMQVNDEVRKRTDGRDMPSAVLLLLLQPWSDYLSFLLLRYGDQSDSWKRALQVVEDLLWSVQPKTLQADKLKQIENHGSLMASLERGFETIGYEQGKGRKLLEAIASLQKMALQSRTAEAAPPPMRSKLESMAAEKAGHSTVANHPITPEEAKITESLKMIEFGTWFEFEGGKRRKIAWYNKKTQHYMLVDQYGRKVSLSAGLDLARDMIAGKAKVIIGSTKPFFERALENIYQTLNARADAAKNSNQGDVANG
jgi:hypothetical protein